MCKKKGIVLGLFITITFAVITYGGKRADAAENSVNIMNKGEQEIKAEEIQDEQDAEPENVIKKLVEKIQERRIRRNGEKHV